MSKSPASTRAYEHATFSFGLVTIPLSVFSGTASDVGIKRKWFTVDDHEVGYVTVDKTTKEEIPRSEVVTKIATEHGFVFVDDHEIETLFEVMPKTLTVRSFQPRSLFGTTYVGRTPFYVEVPKTKQGTKKIDNRPAQQALALVLAAMQAEDALALVDFTTRGVPKPAVLLPDGTLWVVYHEEELRERRQLPEFDLPETLLEQGKALIEAFWRDEPEPLVDERTAAIQAFAAEKAAAGDFGQAVAPVLEIAPAPAPDDLMALLTNSIQLAKAS